MNKSFKFLAVSLLMAQAAHAGIIDSTTEYGKQFSIGLVTGFLVQSGLKGARNVIGYANIQNKGFNNWADLLNKHETTMLTSQYFNITVGDQVQDYIGSANNTNDGLTLVARAVGNFTGSTLANSLLFKTTN